jgi:GH25 family lysozyme M1 (1,4-beta-N-acetylmuramidase)
MIKGFDISHWNYPIKWDNVSDEFQFVFCKATEGANYKDAHFNDYWQHLKTTNLFRGAYIFWNCQNTPQEHIDNLLSLGIDFSKQGVLPLVIDIENQATPELDKYVLSNKDKCREDTLQLLQLAEEKTGRTPIVYCSPHFLQEYLGDSEPFGKYGLWIAGYQQSVPKLPNGFSDYLIWQYCEKGDFNGNESGGSLDLDQFNGDLDKLKTFANY